MTPARLFVYVVYAALLVGLVVAGAAAVTSSPSFGPPSDEAVETEPTLTSFTTGGGDCVADAAGDASTELRGAGRETVLRVTGRLPVPDTNYAVDTPELVREGPGEYSIDLTASEVSARADRDCPAVAEYELSVTIPADAGPTTITVRHDGEVVTRGGTGS